MQKSFIYSIGLCLSLGTFQASAGQNSGVLDGTYVPVSGHSFSREVSRISLGEAPRQVGRYSVVLNREGWSELSEQEKKRIRKRLVIRGEYTGVMDMGTMTLSHTLVNDEKTGTLYSQGDFLIPQQGDGYCSAGIPLTGVEQINFVAGTGDYEDLVTGTLVLHALVNNCPEEQDYLRNHFDVVVGSGGLTFIAQP